MFLRIGIAFLLLAGTLETACAAGPEITPYLSAQYFTWREYHAARRLLKETGPLFAGGLDLALPVYRQAPNSLMIESRHEVFGGYVDYDGETQEQIPVKTEVSYVGTRHEIGAGWRHDAGGWTLEPFTSLGYRWWFRGLQDATSANGQPSQGYTEYWQTGYLKLGGRGSCQVGPKFQVTGEAGATYPFYASNYVKLKSVGPTTFSPEGLWSPFAQAGLRYGGLRVTVSYEGFRFGASPLKKGFLQPESTSDLIGLNLGWTF
ncbi:hypothetical protein [Geomonas limicola]|uniref:hypothetical protein n=1 Tax=Geomonas limicola TaxID=2740186 RepID=UPI00161969E8|nr:hypothetical protein [Geomonas limicola]